MSEPIAITGVGCVTPFGDGTNLLMAGWRPGECAIADGWGKCADFAPKGPSARPRSAAPTGTGRWRWSPVRRRRSRQAGTSTCPTARTGSAA